MITQAWKICYVASDETRSIAFLDGLVMKEEGNILVQHYNRKLSFL